MMNYYDRNVQADFEAQGFTRTHPWTSAIDDESNQYYDFIEHPELIETSLEDFIPFEEYPAIKTFYKMLSWLNSSDSIFESNDCALCNQFLPNTDTNTPLIAQQKLAMRGRLMFFFRDHILNGDVETLRWLFNVLPKELDNVDPKIKLGIVGYSKVFVAFSALPAPLNEMSYSSICLSFFAWGINEVATMNNLQKVFANTHTALKRISAQGVKKNLPERGRFLLQSVNDGDADTITKFTAETKF